MNKFNIGDVVKCDTDKEFTVAAIRLHAGNLLYFSGEEGVVGRSEEDLILVEKYEEELSAKNMIDMTNAMREAGREAWEALSVSWGDIRPTTVPIMINPSTGGVLHRRTVSREELVSNYKHFTDSIAYATKEVQDSDHITFHREYLNELCTEFEKVTCYTPELTDALTQPLNTDYPKLISDDKELLENLRKPKHCNHEWVATQLFTSTVHDCKLCGAKKK